MGELPAALAATRLVVAWEEQDLKVALGLPAHPDPTALVALDATLMDQTRHRRPFRLLRAADGAGLGVVPEWGEAARPGQPDRPVAGLLVVWRRWRAEDLNDTVIRLQRSPGLFTGRVLRDIPSWATLCRWSGPGVSRWGFSRMVSAVRGHVGTRRHRRAARLVLALGVLVALLVMHVAECAVATTDGEVHATAPVIAAQALADSSHPAPNEHHHDCGHDDGHDGAADDVYAAVPRMSDQGSPAADQGSAPGATDWALAAASLLAGIRWRRRCVSTPALSCAGRQLLTLMSVARK